MSFFFAVSLHAQNAPAPLWEHLEQLPANRVNAEPWVQPAVSRTFALNHAALRQVLDAALPESLQPVVTSPAEITLPMPDGTMARFRMVESPVMAPELAAKFPEIKTYMGQGIDDPSASVRFDITPAGFHAQILSPRGAVYIDPRFRGDPNVYASYYKRDYRRAADDFQCFTEGENRPLAESIAGVAQRSGTHLRKYRLACAATGEYVTFHGGTVIGGLAAIVTAVNRVTGVYEAEVGIRLELVANNDLLVYTNGATDPYTNNDGFAMLAQNQSNVDSVIGSANYDIGHVFSTGGGGVAGLGVVCVAGAKARGVTGLPSPTGDAFYIDYVAHEVGHQFGGNHTFNSSTGSCGGGNRNGPTAYEPGSGSTIMAYAGICSSDNLQLHSDPYFHSVSFDEMIAFSTLGSGNSCPVTTTTGNSVPTVNAGPNHVIPAGTPFVLTATGNDANGDVLTYCWEERDLGPATTLSAPDNGSSPLFRSYNPTTNAFRFFPQLNSILFNTNTPGERLPTTTRTMNFRVTVRDNRAGGGGVNTADKQVSVHGSAGPFVVTSPNSSVTWSNVQVVTWNVAGTTAAPINAATVDILLSTNGGLSFPVVLAAATANDGSEPVLLPSVLTAAARIKVQATGNIFFDISNTNFTIIPSAPMPLVVVHSASLVSETCPPSNGAIDPDETVTVNIALRNVGTLNTTNVVATLLTTNGVTFPSGAQTYGMLAAGGPPVTNSYTFTASGSCGSTLGATLQLQDVLANMGTVQQPFSLGVSAAATRALTNATGITIPASGTQGKSLPYPSAINVLGMSGTVSKVTVTLRNVSHTWLGDLDVLLVGPGGQKLILMSDVADSAAAPNVLNRTYTFDDAATNSMLANAAPFSGTYKPTNIGEGDTFVTPAPAGPYDSTLATFNGSSPNGTWMLYVFDDAPGDSGNIALGWILTLTTEGFTCCASPSLADISIGKSASVDSLNVGQNVEFTLSVTNAGPTSADAVMVSDSLPGGLNLVSAIASQGTVSSNANVVTAELGTLANGATATVTILATATAGGWLTNSAAVASALSDPAPANNSASAAIQVNSAPFISNLIDLSIPEDSSTDIMPFLIGDAETAASALNLTAASSNTNLVQVSGIVFGGANSNRTFVVTPLTNQNGASTITIFVSDGAAVSSNSFNLTVTPVNDRPVLAPIGNRTIHLGSTVTVSNSATDIDPGDLLTFGFGNGEPAGAVIDPNTGLFTWTPDGSFLNTTNPVSIRVTDNGIPSLSATQSFLVAITGPPLVQTITQSNDMVTITWTAISGQTYRVQYKGDLADSTWSNLPPDVVATGITASKDDAMTPVARFYQIYVVP